MQPASARRSELDDVRERACAALLGEPDEHDEDLGRRAGVGQRTVARLGRDAEEVRQRGEPDTARALPEQASREPDGVDDRRGDAPSGEQLDLAVEEREVEARVVRDDRRVAGEGEQLPDRGSARGAPRQRPLPDSR